VEIHTGHFKYSPVDGYSETLRFEDSDSTVKTQKIIKFDNLITPGNTYGIII